MSNYDETNIVKITTIAVTATTRPRLRASNENNMPRCSTYGGAACTLLKLLLMCPMPAEAAVMMIARPMTIMIMTASVCGPVATMTGFALVVAAAGNRGFLTFVYRGSPCVSLMSLCHGLHALCISQRRRKPVRFHDDARRPRLPDEEFGQ